MTFILRNRIKCIAAVMCTVPGLLATIPEVQASEVRGFTLSWWHIATSSEGGDDCPQGVNLNIVQTFARVLAEQGVAADEIPKRLNDFQNKSVAGGDYFKVMTFRGKDKDGKPANVYAHPESAPDPNLKRSQSKVAYGFNLDGVSSADDFVDPETRETGVDNQYYRALGCSDGFRAKAGFSRPTIASFDWEISREHMPAWLVEVRGIDNYQDDPDVELSLYQATKPATKDASMEVRRDVTMFVDAGSSMRVTFRGRIKDGVFTSDVVPKAYLIADPYITPGYTFRDARVRVKFNEDGTMRGIFGGFLNWQALYWGTVGAKGIVWVGSPGTELEFAL